MVELISVIVTTYNREDALDAVLRSLAGQIDGNFEVIVADDGSAPATAGVVDSWKAKFGRRLEHVWHADRGFRAAEIRNRAILVARGAYCVFLDGDCIVRPDFVGTHRRLAEPGWFVTGNRVLLAPDLTMAVLREKQTPEAWSAARWLAERWRGGVNRLSALLHVPSDICVASASAPGRARAHATSPSGALILIASTGSMPNIADGARKIRISLSVCCMPVSAARMEHSRPA